MMNVYRKYNSVLVIACLMLAAVAQAYLIVSSVYVAIVLTLAALFFLVFHNAPVGLLMILLFLFPFSGTEAFRTAVAEIPGFKPLQIFSMAVLAVAILNIRSAVRLPRSAAVFFSVIILLFTFSFLRSVPNLVSINMVLPEPLSVTRYFLSQYFKPLIYFIPAIILTQYVYTGRDIDRVTQTISWSITFLSVSIIGFFFFNRDLILDPGSTRTFYATSFGLHTNSIANYYIIGFPFVLSDLFRGRFVIGIIKITLCVAGIALLFSRSAYFITIFAFIAYLFISKRAKWLPILLVVLLASVFVIPESVTKRATKGMETWDREEISAGRVDNIWLPLIKENAWDLEKLLLGNGRLAMVSTQVHKKKLILQAMHPHNMYLEMVLDAGLIGLLIILSLFAFLLRKTYLSLNLVGSSHYKEYQVAVITALICFFVSGLTDRTFFPDEINGYLWMMVAMAFILCRHLETIAQERKRARYADAANGGDVPSNPDSLATDLIMRKEPFTFQ